MDNLSALDSKSDHDLLVVAVTELRHIKNHVKDLAKESKTQNGRVSALEHSMIRVFLALGLIGSTWPFFIYEVRQWVLEKFGFIP